MISLQSLGGSGEDSRSCFLVSDGSNHVLLDCGVRREIGPVQKVYPLLSRETALSLDAVFLSHAHEDHCAALPYLYELGYHGPVYASLETISMVKQFQRKWIQYVKDNRGFVPFLEGNIDKITYVPILIGRTEIAGVTVETGRSGHMLGSLWYRFSFPDGTVSYSGDFCRDSLLLSWDMLPKSDVLILDVAYTPQIIHQDEQYASLLKSIKECVSIGGSVLLPVPSNGRGVDLYQKLLSERIPLIVEKTIVGSVERLAQDTSWTNGTPFLTMGDAVTLVDDSNREEVQKHLSGRVILTPDGMLTSKSALSYFSFLQDDPKNRVILTGHTADGTMGKAIQDNAYRNAHGIALSVENRTIKVHLDADDAVAMVKRCHARKVMLFHARKKDCKSLKERLEGDGVTVSCGITKDDRLDYPGEKA